MGDAGVEHLLSQTIDLAKRERLLPAKLCQRLNVDTTVQEKAITYPTDAKLYQAMRQNLVKAAKQRGVKLRQSYVRVGKRALIKQGRYGYARQMKRARKELKKLKTYLARVVRDVWRKEPTPDAELCALLAQAERLLAQQ